MKYFVLGGFSSAFFLYGIALVYGATGLDHPADHRHVPRRPTCCSDGLLLAGIALLLVGLGFKVAAVPFHTWTPDVYQGAPTPVDRLHGGGGQGGGLRRAAPRSSSLRLPTLARRLAAGDLGPRRADPGRRLGPRRRPDRRQADAGLLVDQPRRLHPGRACRRHGHGGHRRQRLAGRLLPAGLHLHGRSAASPSSPSSADGRRPPRLDAYRGLSAEHPALALAFTVFLLAQAGVPFTTGFIAKFDVISAAVARAHGLRPRRHRHAGGGRSPPTSTCGSS